MSRGRRARSPEPDIRSLTLTLPPPCARRGVVGAGAGAGAGARAGVGAARARAQACARAQPFTLLFSASYIGRIESAAGYLFPAISTSHFPPSRYAWSIGTSAFTIASPTAPPSVNPYDAART
jgi:hypothetical protein